eukprot:Gb_37222 [translate_table: standard]
MGKEEYNAIAVHTFAYLESSIASTKTSLGLHEVIKKAESCVVCVCQTNDYCESAYNIIMAMKYVLNPKVVAAAGAFSLLGRTDGFALGKPIARRAYGALAPKVESCAAGSGGIRAETKQGEEKESRRQRSWMPDPVTGYYLPEDYFGETDIVQLRENILRNQPESPPRPN